MRNVLAVAFAGALVAPGSSSAAPGDVTECVAAGFYEQMDTPSGTLAITSYGQIEEAEDVLLPIRQRAGAYEAVLTRRGPNLYRDGTSGLYLRTRYCYEYAYSQRAFIDWDGRTGEVTFR